MSARILVLGWISAAAIIAQEIPRALPVVEAQVVPETAAPESIVSSSNQFRISGGDSLMRASVALLAEETKQEILRMIGEDDLSQIPVIISLHGKAGDPLPARTISLRLLVVEGLSELRLDVHLSQGIEQERFKRAITAALLYERALRQRPEGDADRPLLVPVWLADGLCEAIAWRLNQSDRHLYETLFKRGGLFKIDELFGIGETTLDDMDAAMRAAFRVSSGALVMALLEQPQGKDGFKSFLSAVAPYEGEMPALLRQYFPELNLSETSLAKWWALQLANKGGLNLLTDILTIQQTESALTEALHLHFHDEEGIIQQKDLSAWPQLAALKEPERLAAVRFAQDALVRLSYRCFPSYRALLSEYQALLGAIAKNKIKDVAKRLATLQQTRATMSARAARAHDYLDWFEITRARETSGAFDDYLRLKERLSANPRTRKDPLSQYLDRMDQVFFRDDKPAGRSMPMRK